MARSAAGPGVRGRHAAALAAATLFACLPFWVPRFVPSMDGPQHLLAAHVAVHLHDPSFSYDRHFRMNPSHPLTPILGDRILRALFVAGLEPSLAHKLVLSGWAVALAAALAYLASWRRPEGVLLAVPGLLCVHGLPVGLGFLEFLLSLPPALAALGLVLRGSLGRGRAAALALLLLISVLAHPFTLVALVPALGLAALAARASLLRLGLALAPALAVALASFASNVAVRLPQAQATLWSPPLLRLRVLLLDAFGGVADTGTLGLLAGATLLALGAGPAWRGGGAGARALLAGAGLYAVLALSLPSVAFNWALVHHRFAPLAWLMAFAALGGAPLRRPALAASACVAALLAQLTVTGAVYRRLDAGLSEYVSAAAAVPRGARLLTLDFDPTGESQHPLIRPYLHAWAYVLMERGGMTPYAFATRPVHAIQFVARPPAPPEFLDQSSSCELHGLAPGSPDCGLFRAQRDASYADSAAAYDAVLTWAAPPELGRLLTERGFALRAGGRRLAVYGRADAAR